MNAISFVLGLISSNLTSPVYWLLNNVKSILVKRQTEKVSIFKHIKYDIIIYVNYLNIFFNNFKLFIRSIEKIMFKFY